MDHAETNSGYWRAVFIESHLVGDRIDEMVRAHLQEAAMISPVLSDQSATIGKTHSAAAATVAKRSAHRPWA
jgi:hypothetical protein